MSGGPEGERTTRARLEELADQLLVVSEELTELAIAELRDAVERGDTAAPELEKRLSRARRSIEKAAALLRS